MFDPSASSGGEPSDGKVPIPPPFHRGQRNRIENHVKPIKSEKIQGDFGIGSQSGPRKHTLNARMPPKKTNKNNPPDNSKKENAPANNKKPADDTQTSGEPSGTQPQGPSGGTRSQTKKAEAERAKAQQNPPEESKKTQGESSGTPPESQPGSAEQKPQGKESNSGGRQMTLPVHPKPNTKDETKDNTKQNQPAQAPDQPGDKKDGAEKKDGKGDGEPAGNDDPEKKKADKALEEAKKKEEEEKKYAGTMYHAVTPDPNKYRGLERLDGQREYMRKIGDGNPNASGRYGTHSPSVSGVQSHNQEPGISEQKAKDNGKPETARKRPGEREERVTTGHERVNEKGESKHPGNLQFSDLEADIGVLSPGLTEWHKISPKKQEQLPKGTTPWTDDDLRKNL